MPDHSAIFRILDVNFNRAVEGLRVVEEYLRFDAEDPYRTELYKQLRHDLVAALTSIPESQRYSARDTESDIGTGISVSAEYVRHSTLDVAIASQSRIEQALRCLEEYSKPIDPSVAQTVEQLRYRAYTLGRTLATVHRGGQLLADARLYVLVDGRASESEFSNLVNDLITAGASVIQLRDKRLGDRVLTERARALRQLTRGTPCLFMVNDRPDIARLADADGVHVGQDELTVKDARTILGPDKLIGVSTHTIDQARQAVLDGANYIGCGPTFPSGTKAFDEFPGTGFLREVAGEIVLPAFAIGGINERNLDEVLATGIRRVAIAGAICDSSEPAKVCRRLAERLAANL